jgi:RNA polymerase sigma factor (sigma-70 family)
MNSDTAFEDAQLVQLGLRGDRDAFGRLVARYQSPVCAMAYSACGNISQSEDVAQETFITAWRKLGNLKEPEKFKSWLFGIARNLINNTARRQTRNPLAGATPLDEELTVPAPVSNPAGHAMSKEEEEILWRSLEHIPETYREPLVLFYREHQSIEKVAATLEVSEEAARQRLSRGRKLLHEQVVAFVEGALKQTAPAQAFTLSVLTALPPGAAGRAAASVGVLAAIKGLFAKVLPPAIFVWAMMKLTESRRERIFAIKAYAALFIGSWVFFPLCLVIIGYFGGHYWVTHPDAFTIAILCLAFAFIAVVGPYTFWMARVQKRIRKEEAKSSEFSMSQRYEYRSPCTFLGLPLVHVLFNAEENGKPLPARGWIAFGNRAYGILYAAGVFSVGGISCGASAIGIIAIGGFSAGLFSFGGMAVGVAAMGGGSIGYMALGGGAIGWLAAGGGAAVARHFAVGGGVIAQHANDHAANVFMQTNPFFRNGHVIFWILICFSWIVPSGSTLLYKWLRQRNFCASQPSQKSHA